jgi:hypothetical protein
MGCRRAPSSVGRREPGSPTCRRGPSIPARPARRLAIQTQPIPIKIAAPLTPYHPSPFLSSSASRRSRRSRSVQVDLAPSVLAPAAPLPPRLPSLSSPTAASTESKDARQRRPPRTLPRRSTTKARIAFACQRIAHASLPVGSQHSTSSSGLLIERVLLFRSHPQRP